MCHVLKMAGATVTGYALDPPTKPSLFDLANIASGINSIIADIRDLDTLVAAVKYAQPEIIIHMAAQPIVRDSYSNPVYTYQTNVMGTVNILEAVRLCGGVKSFVNVTTDKVYKNCEWPWGYRESDELNGFDPYSNSKSCSELVTDSYKKSFFENNNIAISTVRAGNVIGGGDFANDRIIPDCVRAIINGENISVRNPYSIRPYQHVLDPVTAYLQIAQAQYLDSSLAGSYNIGPNDCGCINTGDLATKFCKYWGNISWNLKQESKAVHEANFLKLDCSLAKSVFGITPVWDIDTAVDMTVRWFKCYLSGGCLDDVMRGQIDMFLNGIIPTTHYNIEQSNDVQ